MKYVYNVIYYRNNDLFNTSEYESEFFSSIKKAKKFMLSVISDEKRNEKDWDFRYWKIKIIKSELNKENEKREFVYDMKGNLLFDSKDKNVIINKLEPSLEDIGRIVQILPFPWNKYTLIPIEKYGVISGIHEDKYVIYTIDNYQLVHLHEIFESIIIVNESFKKVPKEIINLSKVFKNKLNINENELFKSLKKLGLIVK